MIVTKSKPFILEEIEKLKEEFEAYNKFIKNLLNTFSQKSYDR